MSNTVGTSKFPTKTTNFIIKNSFLLGGKNYLWLAAVFHINIVAKIHIFTLHLNNVIMSTIQLRHNLKLSSFDILCGKTSLTSRHYPDLSCIPFRSI